VPAKVTKLIGLKRPPFLSPTNLIIFACTQNGEYVMQIRNHWFVNFCWLIDLNCEDSKISPILICRVISSKSELKIIHIVMQLIFSI
jgi:hypothetical protein